MLNPNLCLNYLPLVNENGENHGGYYNDVLARNDDAKNVSVLESAINDMMRDIEKAKIRRNDWAILANGKVNNISRFIMEHTSKADEHLIDNILCETTKETDEIDAARKDIIHAMLQLDRKKVTELMTKYESKFNYGTLYQSNANISSEPVGDGEDAIIDLIKLACKTFNVRFLNNYITQVAITFPIRYNLKGMAKATEEERKAEDQEFNKLKNRLNTLDLKYEFIGGDKEDFNIRYRGTVNRGVNISDEFKKAVKDDKVLRVRIMLKDSLLANPSDSDDMFKYASHHMKNLIESKDNGNVDIISDKSKWTTDYMNELMVDIVNNFTKERWEHLKNVTFAVSSNKSNDDQKSKDSKNKPKFLGNIRKLASDLLRDLWELLKSLGSRDFSVIKSKWKTLTQNFVRNAKNTALGKKLASILSKTPNTTKEAKEQIDNINDTIKGSKSEDLNESVYSTTLDEKIEGYDDMVRNAIDVSYRDVESNSNSSSKPKNKTNTVKLVKLVSDFVSDLLDLLKGLGSKNFSTIKNRWKVLCDNFVRNVRDTALGQAVTKIFKKTPDTKSEAKDQVNQLNNLLTEAKNKNMNETSFRNDKGETVPKKCTKCGGDVKLYIKGEPVYLCSECSTYYGTKPFNENILDTPVEISDAYEFNKCAKYIDALHLAVSAIYRNVSCYKRMINCAKAIADSLLSSDMAPSDIKTASINYDDKCCNIYSDIRTGILNDQQKFGITESELNSCHMSIAIKRMYGGFGNLSALSESDETLCKDRIHRLDLELDKCVDELSTVADMLKCNSDLFNKIDQIRARSMGGYNNTFLDNVVNDLNGMVGEVSMTFDDIKRIKMCVMPVTHNNDLEDSYKVNRSEPMDESVNQRSIYYRLGESETFNLVNQMTSVNGAPMVHNITKMVKEGYGFKHLGLHDLDKTVIYDIFETNQYFTSSPGLKGAIRALLGNGSVQMVYSDSIKIDVSIPYVVMAGKTPRIFVNVSDFLKINPAGKYEYSIVRNKGGLVAIIFAACVSYTILRKYTTLPNDLNVPVALMHANMLTSVIDRLIHMDPVTKDKVKYICTKYALIQMYGTATGTNIFYNVFRKKYFVQLSPLIMDSIDSQFNEDSFDSLSKLIDALVANYQSMRKLNYKTVWATWYKRYGAACALSIDYIGFHIYTICMLLYESPLINRLVLDPILKQSRGETTLMLMQDMVAKSL